jgi:hypothetical protein
MDSICTIARRKMAGLRFFIGILGWGALAGSSLCRAADDNALKLWYRQPAGAWTQALPVGNGRLAAMVFGDVRKERLQLNQDTIWSGEKRDRSNPEAPKAFPEVRRLLLDGNPAEAQALADRAMISIPRALPVYQTLGDLWLDSGAQRRSPITTASLTWTPASPPSATRRVESATCVRSLPRRRDTVSSCG